MQGALGTTRGKLGIVVNSPFINLQHMSTEEYLRRAGYPRRISPPIELITIDPYRARVCVRACMPATLCVCVCVCVYAKLTDGQVHDAADASRAVRCDQDDGRRGEGHARVPHPSCARSPSRECALLWLRRIPLAFNAHERRPMRRRRRGRGAARACRWADATRQLAAEAQQALEKAQLTVRLRASAYSCGALAS
jgi:hypothetical protein